MFDGDSLARPLGGGDGVPVEPPGPLKVRTRSAPHARWVALAAFGLVGSTGILLISGLSEVQGSTENAWRDRAVIDFPTAEAIPDGPPVSEEIHPIRVAGLPSIGRGDAKVTLVAVTDYACKNCETTRSIIAGLRGAYGDDLRIVWKPLARDPGAAPALAGMCAAALQGELDRYDDQIWRLVQATVYDQRSGLPDASAPDCASSLTGCPQVMRAARDVGLDGQRFASAMKRCAATVADSTRELDRLGITRTSYFVNGRMVDPWGLDLAGTFQNLIDAELARARRRIAAGATQARYYEQWVLDVSP